MSVSARVYLLQQLDQVLAQASEAAWVEESVTHEATKKPMSVQALDQESALVSQDWGLVLV
jgi:hypothetical protein